MDEEKLDNPETSVDEDFADSFQPAEPAPAPAPVEEAPVEEAKPEEEEKPEEYIDEPDIEDPESPFPVEEEKEEETPEAPAKKKKETPVYEYKDPRLANIEKARADFSKIYRKGNIIKTIISVAALAVIIVGWIVPTTLLKDRGMVGLYIALGVAAFGAIAMFIASFLIKKNGQKAMDFYFTSFYENLHQYMFDGLEIENLQGGYKDKITADEFKAMGVFSNVASIGSRDNISFIYKGTECSLVDCAAEKDSGKGLRTIFVGKYLRAHNVFEGSEDGLVIYFKGGDRALPPDGLKSLHPLEGSKRYTIYGKKEDKRFLRTPIRQELRRIRTGKLLCDVLLVIKPGKTYLALGYDDPLMLLPSDRPFNPEYVEEFKPEFHFFLELITLLNKKPHELETDKH